MTAAELIVVVLGGMMREADCVPEVEAARRRISERYSDLKRTHGFMESERMAKVEWLTEYLASR